MRRDRGNKRSLVTLAVLMLCAENMISQQITIGRIELMPNEPFPYMMRDWKRVARGYDSLVFNTTLQGQYLPLAMTYAGAVNYPGQTTFALSSYVGSSLGSGEGINCIPAIVGSSLVGIDKSNQNGLNWVAMCCEWFNKANGQNVYLNSPNGRSGSDWWYETMPNVFFCQLFSLYPSMPDFEEQFRTLANRWRAAIYAMGGGTAPWGLANIHHRAFNLATMAPNNSGVVEPEAAGAIAWILYQAYVKTGDERYRVGAELAMESLLIYTTNPSYELQLPYGTLAAARMNAEIGTGYDTGKMLEWCFANGDGTLRQWGVTTGTWGGMDCSGLVGEINHVNDYPFFMNTVEQIGALVPLARYDDRYARSIGKWVLNASNSLRLFYSNFLPEDHQDSRSWGQQWDPHSLIAYEAVRQYSPMNVSLAPFATGDALKNGWAPTNYALYGASHVGLLAAVVDTTDVTKILRIDLLATDFLHAPAYPTFLYFNPYGSDTTVLLDVGPDPRDLYNTVTKTYLRRGVSGKTGVMLRANTATVVVVAPAGGSESFSLDRMFVNGVVVDYRSSRALTNYPPRIKSLTPDSSVLTIAADVRVFCTATDRDADSLTYAWSCTAGTLTGNGPVIRWRAPSVPGVAVVSCVVRDARGAEASANDTLTVLGRQNTPPAIERFKARPRKIDLGKTSSVECLAFDLDGDTLSYSWSSQTGTLVGTGRTINWTAPMTPANCILRCLVADGHGGSDLDSVGLEVRDLSVTQPGVLVAYYPFNGDANDATGHGHHGAVNGAVPAQDRFGRPAHAFAFDGTSSSIQVPNDAALNFRNGLTVSFWLTLGAAFANREQYPISHGNWQNRWKFSVSPGSNTVRFTVRNSMGQVKDLDSETALQRDSLSHIAGCFDGADLELYLNGELDAFVPFAGALNTTTYALTFGQALPGDNNYNFQGILDEIRIYDRALSPQEISDIVVLSVRAGAENGVPTTFSLAQNYPNPFNPSTTITVGIPGGDAWRRIRLRVFDLLGREVASLFDGRLAQGYHAVLWNAGTLASGAYLCCLESEGSVISRKMLYMK